MEIEILKEKETPLLSRKRVTAMLTYSGTTPSRLQLAGELAKKLNVSKDLLVIRHIYNSFGNEKSKVIVNIYKDKKIMEQLELKKLIAKHSKKAEGEEKKE
jgi:small subunit ribosomal protein S24e